MFDFMTSDMRKPLPETFEDLIRFNYTAAVFTGEYEIYNEFVSGREG
jgi:hypothetical protein